jgi:hypothetical protein
LRGTAFDIFGYTEERKMERALPGEYTAAIFRHLDGKSLDLPQLVQLAKAPELVRGYGHIKEANVARYRAECARLEAASASQSRKRLNRGCRCNSASSIRTTAGRTRSPSNTRTGCS